MKIERLKEILKDKKLFFITFILWVLVTCSISFARKNEWQDAMDQPCVILTVGNASANEQEVVWFDKQEIKQDIEIGCKEFWGFSLYITAIDPKIKGCLEAELIDKRSEKIVKRWEYDLEEIKINGYFNFMLDKSIKSEERDIYTVTLKMNNYTEFFPQLTFVSDEEDRNVALEIDGKMKKAIIPYRILGESCAPLRYFLLAMYFGMTLILFILCFMLLKGKPIEWTFSISVLVIGILYLFIIPPFVVPDETAHFTTVYAQSSELLREEVIDEEGNVILPSDVLWGEGKHLATRDTYLQFMKGALGMNELSSDEPIAPRKPLSFFNPGYIPQVIGVSFGRVIGVNYEQLLLLGRIFALVWYCFVMFWTIRFLPFGKTIMFIIGMLPMTMQQVVSYSYDSVLLGTCFFAISYFMYIIYVKDKIEKKDIVIVMVVTVVISIIKFSYLPIIGLAIMIPAAKFDGIKRKIQMAVLVIVMSIVSILGTKLTLLQKMAGAATSTPGGSGTKMSLSYCVQYPDKIIEMIYKTFERQPSRWLGEMLASPLGYLEMTLPNIIIIALVAIILLSIFQKSDEKQYAIIGLRRCSVLIVVGVVALIVVALLLDWTTINATQVNGIQGRYFLPILPLIIVLSQNSILMIKKNIDSYLILFMGYIHCMTAFFVTLIAIGR